MCYCNWSYIMSGQGVVERASAELSKRINGLSLRVGKQHRNVGKTSSVMERMTNVFCGNNNSSSNNNNNNSSGGCNNINNSSSGAASSPSPNQIPSTVSSATANETRIKPRGGTVGKTPQQARRAIYISSCPLTWNELVVDEEFLSKFFWYFNSADRSNLARVCVRWKDILYRNQKYWSGLALSVNYKEFRETPNFQKARLYASFIRRGFHTLGMIGAVDEDVDDLINYFPLGSQHVHSLTLKWCAISDRGLEQLIDHLQALYELEIFCCNDLSEGGLWSSLSPRIVSLKLADCINISDEAIGAVAQLLPSLCEFSLQAYHVTDAALGFFTKQKASLNILRLQSCWEITNHGIMNLTHGLPNLTILSLSGCTKISDDGIEIITDHLRKLRSLDLSWCPRITDVALECIATDLTNLQQLTLDRCVNITDNGIHFISRLQFLQMLFLRWCSQIRDVGVQSLASSKSLRVLSLAGCPLITMGGLCCLTQMKLLQELELTNCPALTPELYQYLRDQLPNCVILE